LKWIDSTERNLIQERPMDCFQQLVKIAIEQGATGVKIIPVHDIVLDERVILKCQVPLCKEYGNHLLCPPNSPSLPQFREVLKNYTNALLIQIRTPADQLGSESEESRKRAIYARANELHEVVNVVEKAAQGLGFTFAAGFIGGACKLCDPCVGVKSGKPCKYPFKARPSMEAGGIDVHRTAQRAGLVFSFDIEKEVVWNGLVLLE
jgi:predicted metal-binding protein